MKIIIPIIVLIILVSLVEIYSYIFRRRQPKYLLKILDKREHADDYYTRRAGNTEAIRRCKSEKFEMKSDRGETLCGWYYPCGEGNSKKMVLFFHGYHSCGAEAAGMFREFYHSRGFDIFAIDTTACGESGGRVIGYGVLESADGLKWIDFLREHFGEDIKLVLHGISLGAATVMKMSDRVPENVKFIVEDSGFTDARDILKKKSGALFPLMAWMQKVFGHCDVAESCVLDNVKNAKAPILVVHGQGDDFVPFEMAPKVFELCPEGSDTLFTPELKHTETSHYNRTGYEAKLDEFMEKYI